MNELLSLFIRTNDSPIDSSTVWDYLTLKDLYQLRSVCKHTYDELKLIEYNHCRDGNDYLVPFPGYPGVLCTNSDVQEGSGMCVLFLRILYKCMQSTACVFCVGLHFLSHIYMYTILTLTF